MISLFEGSIDRSTSEQLKSSNRNIIKTTDSFNDLNGESFYGDMSNIAKVTTSSTFMRMLADECKKLDGYTNRIVYIPVDSWAKENKSSPIHFLVNAIKNNPDKFKESFAGISFVFINSTTGENFGLIVDDYRADQYNSVEGLLDRITNNGTVKAVTGANSVKKTPEKQVVDKEAVAKKKKEENKKKLVKSIAKAVENSGELDEDDAINSIIKDEDVIKLLDQVEEDETPAINKTRAARMSKLNREFLQSTVGNGSTVASILFDKDDEIKPAHLKVASINKEDWDKVKFSNFENSYDIDQDIYAMLYSLGDPETKRYPVVIRKITVEDASTSMDYLYTYRVECEDSFGKRFTLKFDIPKFINNRFMMLRGNEKSMSGQLMLLPCLKTDQDTVQIVSNYNKIFIRRYGMAGKSYPVTDKLVKALGKYKGSKIKITSGDNTLICNKYELPVDFIDLASNFLTIETPDKIYYTDIDVYFKKYNGDLTKGIPYAVDKSTSNISYYTDDDTELISFLIASELCAVDEDFADIFNAIKPANRLSYSQASILANKIPLVVLLGYHIGLEELMKKAKINYTFGKNLRPKNDNQAVIRFEDTNVVYDVTYESSMLLNGLSECDTRNYSLADMSKKATWLDFLDNFGGRILSDGLDNFRDLFMDPITKEVCEHCKLPTNYIDILIYANNLLADNKYNRHTDISGNRYRTNEIVAAYFYIALAKSYEQYANAIKRGNKGPMTMKQTAVIDAILTSNISSDLSTLSPLLELTTAGTATFKGPSGMNSDRAYSLDKRTYDESMINKLALSTGFSANVGIDRQTTIDMDVEGKRGYIKATNPDDMSVTKTFSMSEAITPFGVTRVTY